MRCDVLQHLRSPESGAPLALDSTAVAYDDEIKDGLLVDTDTGTRYAIRDFIPRFVPGADYVDSFGLQWNRYRQVQLDRCNGSTLSRDRLFRQSKLSPDALAGKQVLEAGCGAGRFTQVLLDAGAELFSFDYSSAIDACRTNHVSRLHLSLAQADIYHIPCAKESFDLVLCYGVLQHTPDPKKAFLSLVSHVKKGGRISIDVYRAPGWRRKYFFRTITSRLPSRWLLPMIHWYVPRLIPVDNALHRLPWPGRAITKTFPLLNLTGKIPLSHELAVEWSCLDTFDALATCYDYPQSVEEITHWFEEAGLTEIDVFADDHALVIGNAVRP
jgi:SAM-dependent methyltransferase